MSPKYLNTYTPPAESPVDADAILRAAPEELDLNFVWDVPEVLESDKVRLVPFIPSVHLPDYLATTIPHPSLFTYLPYGPFPTPSTFLTTFYAPRILHDPASLLLAIYDLASPRSPPPLAGVIGLLNSSPAHLSAEIGHITIFPSFQRTHVLTHACALLLAHVFGPLQLRRVQWQANALNAPSVRAAKRLGLKDEGTQRWQRVLSAGKEGREWPEGEALRRKGQRERGAGRDSAVLSVTWEEWEMGGKEKVQELVERKY